MASVVDEAWNEHDTIHIQCCHVCETCDIPVKYISKTGFSITDSLLHLVGGMQLKQNSSAKQKEQG